MRLTIATLSPFQFYNSQVLQFTRFYEVDGHHSQSISTFKLTSPAIYTITRLEFEDLVEYWSCCDQPCSVTRPLAAASNTRSIIFAPPLDCLLAALVATAVLYNIHPYSHAATLYLRDVTTIADSAQYE